MRKVFTGAFSDRALKEQEPLFLQYINMLVEKLKDSIRENLDQEIDMVRMLSTYPSIPSLDRNKLIKSQTSRRSTSWGT